MDGVEKGDVPIPRLELSPGDHTVKFVCEGCPTPEEKVFKLTVRSGEGTRKIVRF